MVAVVRKKLSLFRTVEKFIKGPRCVTDIEAIQGLHGLVMAELGTRELARWQSRQSQPLKRYGAVRGASWHGRGSGGLHEWHPLRYARAIRFASDFEAVAFRKEQT